MRRKARVKKASSEPVQEKANSNVNAIENTHLGVIKQTGRPTKTPAGKGLGKAGAKRLGRLLKRAVHVQESSAKGKVPLPKTPVRLFKHQIETEVENAPKTNSAKPASPKVSQLILSVVSQCKHRGGMSMADLKKMLAAGGYDITKNNRQVEVVTKTLLNSETLVRTTKNASFMLSSKKHTDTKQVKASSVKSPKPKAELKQSKTARKSTKGTEKSQRQARRTLKPKRELHKPKGKTRKPAAKSYKPRWKTSKLGRTSPKPVRKQRRYAKKQATRVRKAPRKARRVESRRPKQNRHQYKHSPTATRRLRKTRPRFKTRLHQRRRRAYYY
uniref:histone H1-like n=1 Tax=Scatophagus argus TaxID=75038 RepID=UPI001ED835D5|nr:histone H1-like [Scatophagus argus]